MHISEFHIKNFKSFEDVKIHFNEKTNILTGINNAGKSTMLEALSMWQECYNILLRIAVNSNNKLSFKSGEFAFGIVGGIQVPCTDIISVRSPGYDDVFYNLDKKKNILLSAKLINGDRHLEIGFTIVSVDGGNNYRLSLSGYSGFNYKLLNDSNFIKNPETAIKVLYAAPLANLIAKEERQHILKIQYLKQSHTAHLAFRNRIEALHKRRNDMGNPYDTFCDQLSTILLDDNGQVAFDIGAQDSLELKLKIKVGAEQPKDISLVGSGTLQIMEILLNIHEQKSELNIILLDEPDSHIHRQLQARLLNVLNASDNTQIFITTHNESMIRDAQPEWIFHLEKQPTKVYYPVQRDKSSKKGLLSSAKASVIQTLAGTGNGLDFINALESDVLFMVEGVNDALRIQKILSLKSNDRRKYAFWVMGNVDTIFDQLGHYKNVFSEIRNEKSLWEKLVLVFDKDILSDLQRERLIDGMKTKLKLKQVHIWESYSFDSILFSNLDFLTAILQRYIRKNSPASDISELAEKLNNAMETLVTQKNETLLDKITPVENKIEGELKKRQAKFDKLGLQNIIGKEFHLQKAILDYLKDSCNVNDVHKIMLKDDCEFVLKSVLTHFNIDFSMEGQRDTTTNFNDLMDVISTSTRYKDWDFILKV